VLRPAGRKLTIKERGREPRRREIHFERVGEKRDSGNKRMPVLPPRICNRKKDGIVAKGEYKEKTSPFVAEYDVQGWALKWVVYRLRRRGEEGGGA